MQYYEALTFRGSIHIDSVSFFSPSAKSLRRAKEWRDIPIFCVITGPNGSGKTHLLEYLDKCLSQELTSGRHIYLDINSSANSMSDYKKPTFGEDYLEFANKLHDKLHSDRERPNETIHSFCQDLFREAFWQDHKKINVDKFVEDLTKMISAKTYTDADTDTDACDQRWMIAALMSEYLPYCISVSRSIGVIHETVQEYNRKGEIYVSQNFRNVKDWELLKYARENWESIFPEKDRDESVLKYHFDKIKNDVQEHYLESKVSEVFGGSPLKEINRILKKYHFPFEISECVDLTCAAHSFALRRTNMPGFPLLDPSDLSSGEKKILDILVWFYYHSSDKIFDDRRVSVMLFDEPDRHLDPHSLSILLKILSKEFTNERKVQIIMTTHRPDTVNLVPEESLFLLNRDKTGISEVVPVYKEYALSRLFKNLREVTSIQLKVWTESTNDAFFYNRIYDCLWDYSEEQRNRKRKGLMFKDLNGDEHFYQFLSRQYTLNFVFASSEKGTQGGWKHVQKYIISDQNYIKGQELKSKNKKKQTQARVDPRV